VRIGIDVGGTFTDLVAVGPRGIRAIKVPSTPEAPERGIWHAYDAAELAEPPEALIHGTTVATNALLERTGAKAALVLTAGFEDLLELRRQDRASLYDLSRHHPPPLIPRERVVGVAERMGPEGVVQPLTDEGLAAAVAAVRALEPEAVAVSLLFAFRQFNFCDKNRHGFFAVFKLASLARAPHRETRRFVDNAHCGFNLIYILSTGTP